MKLDIIMTLKSLVNGTLYHVSLTTLSEIMTCASLISISFKKRKNKEMFRKNDGDNDNDLFSSRILYH